MKWAIGRPFQRLTLRQRWAIQGYAFIMLWLVGFLTFQMWPFIQSFWISFNDVNIVGGISLEWKGLDNYRMAFLEDERFVPTLLDTVKNMAIDVPIILVFSLFTAFLVNQKIRGRLFFRAVFFLPVVIASGLVVERLFEQLVETGQTMGAQQTVTRGIDLPGIVHLYLPEEVANAILDVLNRLTLILWRSGIQILLFLAGFQGISGTYYEAARCDGATDWELFWKVTLPMLSPIILVNIIFTIVDSFTDRFNPMLDLIRDAAFTGTFRMGFAAAMGWVYFAVIFLVLALVLATSRYWVFYSGERDS